MKEEMINLKGLSAEEIEELAQKEFDGDPKGYMIKGLDKLADANFEEFRGGIIGICKGWFDTVEFLMDHWRDQFRELLKATGETTKKANANFKENIAIADESFKALDERLNSVAQFLFVLALVAKDSSSEGVSHEDRRVFADMLGFKWDKSDEEEILFRMLMPNLNRATPTESIQ